MKKLMFVFVWVLFLPCFGCNGDGNGANDVEQDDGIGDGVVDIGYEDVTVDDTQVEDARVEDIAIEDAPEDTVAEDTSMEEMEDVQGEDVSPDALRFTNITCLPDVGGGETVVEGQNMECGFSVEGAAGHSVTLSCEDETGTAVDCSSTSSTQIQPFGSNPLPVHNGWFGTMTGGLGGTTIAIIWVADDTVEQARHRFEAVVVTDDGINEPPTIEVDCGGDVDGNVNVTVGDRLECILYFLDPDPDGLNWDYARTSGPEPVHNPTPYGGLGTAPVRVNWYWQTDAAESGGTWVYTFTVDDGAAAPVTYDLTVEVM